MKTIILLTQGVAAIVAVLLGIAVLGLALGTMFGLLKVAFMFAYQVLG
ncbi:MAG: hypothetical protein WBI20_15000 [Burkholderiaceae bacterium]